MYPFLCIDLPVEFVCHDLCIGLSVEFLSARMYASDSFFVIQYRKRRGGPPPHFLGHLYNSTVLAYPRSHIGPA